jgi:hypothetical protein
MGDIEISDNQQLDADPARAQQSDHILGQLALATIMLSLEVDLLAFVRAVNAAGSNAAPIEQAQHRPFARLLHKVAAMNIRLPWQPAHHQPQHSPA